MATKKTQPVTRRPIAGTSDELKTRAAKDMTAQEQVDALVKTTETDTDDPAAVVQQSDEVKISLEQESNPAPAVQDEEETVTVIIPHDFRLVLQHGVHFDYKAGVDEMPKSHLAHWWTRAQGVKAYAPSK